MTSARGSLPPCVSLCLSELLCNQQLVHDMANRVEEVNGYLAMLQKLRGSIPKQSPW